MRGHLPGSGCFPFDYRQNSTANNSMYIKLYNVPYNWKIWQGLNLADRLESARAKILADLNLAVLYGIDIHIYACKKYWRTFNLAVVGANCQTAKFNSPPNFPAIW